MSPALQRHAKSAQNVPQNVHLFCKTPGFGFQSVRFGERFAPIYRHSVKPDVGHVNNSHPPALKGLRRTALDRGIKRPVNAPSYTSCTPQLGLRDCRTAAASSPDSICGLSRAISAATPARYSASTLTPQLFTTSPSTFSAGGRGVGRPPATSGHTGIILISGCFASSEEQTFAAVIAAAVFAVLAQKTGAYRDFHGISYAKRARNAAR